MVITRTPLRIGLVGGGSDLASFLRYGQSGLTVTMSIDKYVYITLNGKFDGRVKVSYSQIEECDSLVDVKHPLVRGAAEWTNFPLTQGVEITSIADVPSGTGLGSSSAFTVGTLLAMYEMQRKSVTSYALADAAIEIEGHGGQQDAVAAALGGLRVTTYLPTGGYVTSLAISRYSPVVLAEHLVLLYLGRTRDANKLLKRQTDAMRHGSSRDLIQAMVHAASDFVEAWREGAIESCGQLMSTAWLMKRRISHGITSPDIDRLYAQGMEAGAYGGKLLGAGGGGFLCFIAPPKLHNDISEATGLDAMPVALDDFGTQTIFNDERR